MVIPASAVSAEQYERLALAEPDRRRELDGGVLREKPLMSMGHDWVQSRLLNALGRQLDPEQFWVQFAARLKWDDLHYYTPDVCVVPMELLDPDRRNWRALNRFEMPLPFVAEVWSPSTGDYDIDSKLPTYQRRGDVETWRLHPFDHVVTIWRRQPDGSHAESTVHGGTVTLIALPNVAIDLDDLFA